MRASLKSLQLSKLRQPTRSRQQPDEPVGATTGITHLGGHNDSTYATAMLAIAVQTC